MNAQKRAEIARRKKFNEVIKERIALQNKIVLLDSKVNTMVATLNGIIKYFEKKKSMTMDEQRLCTFYRAVRDENNNTSLAAKTSLTNSYAKKTEIAEEL